MAKRQPYQIVKTESGKWFARVTVKDTSGKTTRPSRTFGRKADATAWALMQLSNSATGKFAPRVPLRQVCDEFLATCGSLAPKTQADYQRACSRLCAAFPDARIDDITSPMLQQFINGLKDGRGVSLSDRSKKYTLAAVRQVFGYALDDAKYISVAPRAKALSVPRTSVTDRDVLNEEQAARFLRAAQPEPCWDLLRFMLETGVRLGEALALEPTDIDRTGVVTIAKTATNYDRTVPAIKQSTKTQSSTRRVKIRPELHALLRGRTGRVFPYTYHQVRAAIDQATSAAGLHAITPHVLRHTACTLLLRAGANLKTVSATLGHEDAAFTLNAYATFIPQDLDSVPEAWTGVLGQDSGSAGG